ncbi:MAG: autoinducer binding domain-containing protein [Rhizobiaceae bacterium]|nr:autoinducer binding domain-containing protein [Rhizobiaceae bacterium]MCZ8351774.1 autoinducer binding domain-containing protein [Rhizobium sp.]
MRKTYPFDPLIEAIVTARDPDALTNALQDFCRRFGFLYFAYLRLDGSRWRAVSNYPQDWQERYYTLNYSRVDPIVHAVKQGVHPFCWSLDDAVLDQERRDVRAFRDDARAHGIMAGFSIPVRVGFSHHSVLTFASSDTNCLRSAMTLDTIEAATTTAMLHLAFTQAKNRWSQTSSAALTPFEIICLRWIAEGKTMQDVADLLEQKYSTVRVSVDRARGKLDAVTLQQATAVATRLALI